MEFEGGIMYTLPKLVCKIEPLSIPMALGKAHSKLKPIF
jgi:hypothetical protein